MFKSLWSLLFLSIACASPSPTTSVADASPARDLNLSLAPGLTLQLLPWYPSELSTEIQGHTLLLEVRYCGGLTTHRYDVVAIGRIAVQSGSSRGETLVWLQHDGAGDSCGHEVTDRLRVNLRPIDPVMIAAGVDSVVFHFRAANGQSADLLYSRR